MSNRNHVRIPKKLADAFDTYFQTSRFAQRNFVKFNKDLTIGQIQRLAERYGYTLDTDHALGKSFKGTFKISGGRSKKNPKNLRISARTLPLAEDWTTS